MISGVGYFCWHRLSWVSLAASCIFPFFLCPYILCLFFSPFTKTGLYTVPLHIASLKPRVSVRDICIASVFSMAYGTICMCWFCSQCALVLYIMSVYSNSVTSFIFLYLEITRSLEEKSIVHSNSLREIEKSHSIIMKNKEIGKETFRKSGELSYTFDRNYW